jgi:ankyrin repeat protein
MKTEADIKSAMRALPQNTLNDLYEEDFTQLLSSGQHTRGHAMHVFSILLCTQEALSPEALVQATVKTASLQGETMTLAKMIDICLNLVALDPELNIMRFAHISFQEFLETKAEFAPQSIHRVAATSCLDFCLEGSPTGMEIDLSPKDNFHRYSAIYWAEHCRIATDNGFNDLLTNKMREFVFDEGEIALTFVDWNQEVSQFVKTLPNDHVLVKELRSVIDSGGSPLFTACVFGLTSIVKDLAQMKEYDWNRTNDLGQSGLYLAAATGRKTIIQGLLRLEVNVNISGGKFDHPLHAACAYGHSSVVKLLLDHGANPKIGSKSALEYSLLAGHESVASLLLTSKFGISSQAEYDSILQQSAEAGFTDVVRFLCKEYASLYGERGSSRCRAVEVAIFKGRIGVVERYIQRSSDPKIDIPADAIATAALGGQNSMISLLVDQGLDLDAEGVFGTPLRAACLMCHESTVRLLLKFGASLHISGPFGEPLQAAAMRGHVSIIRTLLSNGANMNGTGGLYGTALQAAAHRGHQKVVEILLDAGADVHQDGFSRDAFHAASEGGHEEVVRLLLDKGFKIQHDLPGPQFSTTWPSPYKNLLRDASPNRYNGTKPAQDHQPKSKDWRQRASTTDSSHVVERMRGFVVSELETVLPYRERPEYRRLGGPNYALPAAAAKGHVNVVKLLFGQLNKMDIPKSEIVAAFNQACENGHEEVASIMISDQIEVQDLQNALGAAALNGHMTVVNFLIDHEDRLGLARIETVSISRPAAKSSNRDITSAPNQVCRPTNLAFPRQWC